MARKKNSLVENINRRKRAGKSRPKARSTVAKSAYDDMQRGWPGKRSSKNRSTKKSAAKKKGAGSKGAKRKTAKRTAKKRSSKARGGR
jgi:hypothetical protein